MSNNKKKQKSIYEINSISSFDGYMNYTFISRDLDAQSISKDSCHMVLCFNKEGIFYFLKCVS